MTELILASASPRRRELLAGMGAEFEVVVSDADESGVSKDQEPSLYVQELSLIKAAATAKQVIKRKRALVISADTIVVSEGRILGKPKDDADAFNMLKALSGKAHEVYTGYCIMRMSDGYSYCKSVKTEVYFKDNSDEKIMRYIKTGEPTDKAGAYGIQGLGAMLIEKIHGDYFNVVGLPVSALAQSLADEFGVELL